MHQIVSTHRWRLCYCSRAMEYRFKADHWDSLSLAERVRRCRLWAAEAQQLAGRAHPDLKPSYQSIADQWVKLAQEIEQHSHLGQP